MPNRKLNVLLITQNFPPESVGGAIHSFEVARYLSKLGCKVDVLTSFPTYPYGEFKREKRLFSEETMDNIKVTKIWTFQPTKPDPPVNQRLMQYSLFVLHVFFRLVPLLLWSRKKYDVVVTSHPPEPTLLLGLLIKKVVRLTWVAEFRDMWLEAAVSLGFMSEHGVLYRLSEKLREKALLSADIFAYVSKTIRERFVKKYQVKAKEVFNPNGVDPERCPLCETKERNIIHLGNIGYAYSLENFVRSLSYLSDNDLGLLFVGGGDKKPDLLRLVSELGFENRVKFVGILSREDAMDLTSKCLIGLCAKKDLDSLEYLIPIKVLEYMGCGIPFVATGRGEIERLAKESEAGLIVESEPSVIAKALNSLIEDPSLRTKMGLNGREFVAKEYNTPETIFRLYQTILSVSY
jgi:colanic acid biosynthesis glycosyl transferase WcaI